MLSRSKSQQVLTSSARRNSTLSATAAVEMRISAVTAEISTHFRKIEGVITSSITEGFKCNADELERKLAACRVSLQEKECQLEHLTTCSLRQEEELVELREEKEQHLRFIKQLEAENRNMCLQNENLIACVQHLENVMKTTRKMSELESVINQHELTAEETEEIGDKGSELKGILEEMEIGKYIVLFLAHEVTTLNDFIVLEESDLGDMNIPVGPKRKLLNKIQELRHIHDQQPTTTMQIEKPKVQQTDQVSEQQPNTANGPSDGTTKHTTTNRPNDRTTQHTTNRPSDGTTKHTTNRPSDRTAKHKTNRPSN